MILDQSYETYEKPGLVQSYKVGAVRIWKGAIVVLDKDGYAVPHRDGMSDAPFVGVAGESVDATKGNPGDKSVNVAKSGSFVFHSNVYSPTLKDLGAVAVAQGDAGCRTWHRLAHGLNIGTVVALTTTSTGKPGYRVRIDNFTV